MFRLRFFALIATIYLVSHAIIAQQPPGVTKPRQFIYLLHLVPRLYDDKSWAEQDKAAVERHFNRLKEATKTGQVILAGRIPESGENAFGIVIFEAANDDAARDFMNNDPAVVAGIMTAELHPFGVALEREKR